MGTGKTAICIGLLLKTKGNRSSVNLTLIHPGMKPNPHNAGAFVEVPTVNQLVYLLLMDFIT
jgi:hypothetical protein